MLFRRRSSEPERRIVAFTVHKAGSMVLHRVLRDICEHNKIDYHSENGPNPKFPARKIFAEQITSRNIPAASVRSATSCRVVRCLRLTSSSIFAIPRDVLTSMFFSYCFMHRGPEPGNTGRRKEVADAGIDKFVLDMSSAAAAKYNGDYGTGGPYLEHIGNMASATIVICAK
jgi:hypothetical protein